MKAFFLDCDGVLNHHQMNWNHRRWPLDPACATRVVRIVAETGCKVVLSSTWRKLGQEAVDALQALGITNHSKTGNCCAGIRGVEIHSWIGKNVPHEERYETKTFRYAILDDDSDMLLWQKDDFFRTVSRPAA